MLIALLGRTLHFQFHFLYILLHFWEASSQSEILYIFLPCWYIQGQDFHFQIYLNDWISQLHDRVHFQANTVC